MKDKLTWTEEEDYRIGKQRFKSDLVPAAMMIARYFAAEQAAIDALDEKIAQNEQQLAEMMEDGSGEDGLLAEVIEGEGDSAKVSAKAVKARLKEIGRDRDYAEERASLLDWQKLTDDLATVRSDRKAAEVALTAKVHARYPRLSAAEVQTLTIDDKWMARLADDVAGELDRVSQTLTGRVKLLVERYAVPLPQLEADVVTLADKVAAHLKAMGATWA